MNKAAIKNFAVWARNKLIADITYKAGLMGVSEKGIAQPLLQSTSDLQFFDIGTKEYVQIAGKTAINQRNALVDAIKRKEQDSDYKTAFAYIIEEVAYTWFNRLVAIRFMEVNDYLPSRIRVLSSENLAKKEPDFVTTPFDTDLEFTAEEQEEVLHLKDENKLDDLFRILFIKQCNKLHEILPELFEKTDDYTEILLTISFTDGDGVVYHLVHDIVEDDFNVEKEGQVEIIGWLYQYYNTELKDETFALLKKNVKITKERIPAATQLFTPDWIVRYMVENSLGRLWVEGHPNDDLKANWKYYLEEAEQEPEVAVQLEKIRAEYKNINPEDIKVIDPCMGSGHILVYCFDVLMQIYEAQGYTGRDAAQSILKNNLYGLDIDKRAAQLAYFAVMMKARQYDRRIFSRGIKPHVYAIEESNGINRGQLKYFGARLSAIESSKAKREITALIDTFVDAKEYGSILNIEKYDWGLLERYVNDLDDSGQMSLDSIGIDKTQALLRVLITQGQIMAQKYDVVTTNPPYMGINNMGGNFYDYIVDKHEAFKHDLYCVFIDVCRRMLKANRFQAMITQQSFMFNSRYEKARNKIISQSVCANLLHLGARAFEEIGGEVVQTVSFIFSSGNVKNYSGKFVDLQDGGSQDEKEEIFLKIRNENHSKIIYKNHLSNFEQIDGSNFSYWLSDRTLYLLANTKKISSIAEPRHGLVTGEGNRFMRLWPEVDINTLGIITEGNYKDSNKWFPYTKGGTMRRWYGNREYVVNWENNGLEIRNYRDNTGKIKSSNYNLDYNFLENISWSDLTTGLFSGRYTPEGSLFDTSGPALFLKYPEKRDYLLAFMNTKVMQLFLNIFCTGLHYSSGSVGNIPFIYNNEHKCEIESLASECKELSKADWDSFETSWDFLAHPLVLAAVVPDMNGGHKASLSDCYKKWEKLCDERFNQLKANEEKLNCIFIDIYGLQDELTPEVEDKDVTVRKADLQRDIKSLLSYAVGCMFGRYSLDEPGLVYAGGDWNANKYSSFIPDKDNCIPITDEEYFKDDLVGQFVGWMKKAFGAENLEENLNFIANVLGSKGKTSREVIRNYFLNDFSKDHCTTYSVTGSGKRPIYWMFDSGKQNGFKALVYMHRWNADTVGNLRVEYLHSMQRVYESEITRMQEVIDNSRDSHEVSAASKRKEKLQKQMKETKDYDAKLAHIALSRIEIDLDDGVKVNYEKVQTGRDGKKMQILAKI